MDDNLSSKRYEPSFIDLNNKNNSHTLIIDNTGFNKKVLEIGTSTGYISKILKEHENQIIGIEIDEESALIAQQFCDRMIVGDIESLNLYELFIPASFDVIICGDVLEHLKKPDIVLKNLRKFLKPDGYIVVSLPNFFHGDVMLNLLYGDFHYTPMGILDETHLRFFGLKNICEIFTECGYQIRNLRTTKLPIGSTELKTDTTNIPHDLLTFIESLPSSTVYQYIFTAYPSEDSVSQPLPAEPDIRTLFYRSHQEYHIEIQSPLEEKIREQNILLANRDQRLQELEQINSLKVQRLQELEQINSLKDQRLQELVSSINSLEQEISAIKTSIVWQLTMKFHTKIVERLLPQNTRRRKYYTNGLYGGRLLLKGGYHSFCHAVHSNLQKETMNDYQRWIERNEPQPDDLSQYKSISDNFSYRPKISIITPVWNTDEKWLCSAIESMLTQVYDNWELCLADGGSTKPHVKKILKKYAKNDDRIKVKFLAENKGISGNSNEALSLATGEFIGLLDHDDTVAPHALFEVVSLLNKKPNLSLIYTDEDKISQEGHRESPFFKPDWSPDLILSCGYINHLTIYRKHYVDKIGGFRHEYEFSQDYDLLLRFLESIRDSEIGHISKVLYHWRESNGSSAYDPMAKNGKIISAAKKVIQDALTRRKIEGIVLDGLWPTSYRVKRKIHETPKISIIIPTKDKCLLLKRCIESIEKKSTYPNYEIIIVNHDSSSEDTIGFLKQTRHRIIHYSGPFNFSEINNLAVQHAQGDYLLFLNNDTEVISSDWMECLLEHAQRPEVGAVGCKLLYPDKRLQHVGVILGMSPDRKTGIAGHWLQGLPHDSPGYFNLSNTIRNYSAITGACMMVSKEKFLSVGGFEPNLAVCYNDIDFCLKLIKKNYWNVFTPYAELIHYESASRGCSVSPDEARFMLTKWGTLIKEDPFYNVNLSLSSYFCEFKDD